MLIYIAMPSLGCFHSFPKNHDPDDPLCYWEPDPVVLNTLAFLEHKCPQAVLVSPSLQNYALLGSMPPDVSSKYEAWKKKCRMLLNKSEALWILAFDGWDKSVGVQDEMAFATELSLPIRLIKPLNMEQNHWPRDLESVFLNAV